MFLLLWPDQIFPLFNSLRYIWRLELVLEYIVEPLELFDSYWHITRGCVTRREGLTSGFPRRHLQIIIAFLIICGLLLSQRNIRLVNLIIELFYAQWLIHDPLRRHLSLLQEELPPRNLVVNRLLYSVRGLLRYHRPSHLNLKNAQVLQSLVHRVHQLQASL